MAYLTGNARLRASARDVTKTFEPWAPFEMPNVLRTDTNPHEFYRLRHIAILPLNVSLSIQSFEPEHVLVRLPAAIVSLLPHRAQISPASVARHGLDVPNERWISSASALVDPGTGDDLAHYIRITSDAGFILDRHYDILATLTLELE